MATHNDPPPDSKPKQELKPLEGTIAASTITEQGLRKRALEDKKKHLEAKLAELKKLPQEQSAESIRKVEQTLQQVNEGL